MISRSGRLKAPRQKILKIASRIGRTAKSTIIPDTCHRALLFEDSRAHKTVLTLR